jgi:RNA polymerase sigma factor (sigma-70 family)
MMSACVEEARPLSQIPPVEDLYATHAPWMYRQLLARTGGSQEDAQDLLQEAFMRIVGAYPRLQAPFYPKAWLSVILSHLVIDWQRRRRCLGGAETVPLSVLDVEEEPEDPAAQVSVQVETTEIIQRALAACTVRERVALLLRVQGCSYQEIAERLGWRLAQTKMAVCRARRRVRAMAAMQEVGHD